MDFLSYSHTFHLSHLTYKHPGEKKMKHWLQNYVKFHDNFEWYNFILYVNLFIDLWCIWNFYRTY